MKDTKKFMKLMDKLSRKYDVHNVFSDFISISICCLSQQQMEDYYFEIIKKYDKDELLIFSGMFAEMVIGMENKYDFLGHIYMEIRSKSKGSSFGQFFTPEHVCDLMTQCVKLETKYYEKVNDPCCGSGRLLISYAKFCKPYELATTRFVGADLDHLCVKMTMINCCLNGLLGEFYHMNTLSYEIYNGYRIDIKNGIPCVSKLSQEILDKWKSEGKERQIVKTVIKKQSQLTLF